MYKTIIFIFAILISTIGCGNNSTVEVTKTDIYAKGVFCKIEKVTDKAYHIYLKIDSDSCIPFVTFMPIGEQEIERLKKDQPNIELRYDEFLNKETKTTGKIVKWMVPIYDDGK